MRRHKFLNLSFICYLKLYLLCSAVLNRRGTSWSICTSLH